MKSKLLLKETNISRSVFVHLATCLTAGLSLVGVAVFSQGLSAGAPSPVTYSNLVSEALLRRAQEASRALIEGGFLPPESFTNAEIILEGQSTHPSGQVLASRCEYSFRGGSLQNIRRRNLFDDKGSASLILQHLTNEILTLTPDAATKRALEVLQSLSYPASTIRDAYRFNVHDDLMDAHPIRDGGPNFPKDLHFYGELISRKKIKMSVGISPADAKALGERERTRIDFLATTGELLEAWWLPEFEALARLGIHGPEPITVAETPDFAPPRFVSATRKLTTTEASSPKLEVAALVRDAWTQLQQQLGTNRPKCVLICENLNNPGAVVAEMTALAADVPWAGVSHFFNNDLPFERNEMDRLAQDKRGIRLLGICGGVETRLEMVSDLKLIEPPGEGELASPGDQQKWKQIYDEERRGLEPRIDALIQRLNMAKRLPDHALFLVCAKIPFPSGSAIENELSSRLRGKAQVISVMGESDHWSVGDGVTYFNGKLITNGVVIFGLRGFLPLQQDTMRLMALRLASLTNSPNFDPEKLRTLQLRPPTRILSGEAINPVRDLAYAFGPHPLEELVHFFGLDQIKMLQAADKLEVFEIKSSRVENPPTTGTPIVEGYEQVAKGKTLDRRSAQEFAAALLTEKNGIRAMSSCFWQPIVVFRAWHGDESASLVVCFQCNESIFRFYDAAGKLVRHTHPFLFSGREVLLRLAREALPESPNLKRIAR